MAESRAGRAYAGMSARFGANGKGNSFVVVGVEGVVVALIGIYMLIFPDDARDNVRFIAGLVLIVTGLYQLERAVAFYRNNTHRAVVPLRFVAGAVMLFGGILVAIEKLTTHFNADASKIVLAATLLVAGIFGLAAGLLGRRDGDLKLGNMIASVVIVVLAGLNISEVRTGDDNTQLLGVIVVLLGLALLAYAYWLHQQRLDQERLGEPATAATYYPPTSPEEPASSPADPAATYADHEPAQ